MAFNKWFLKQRLDLIKAGIKGEPLDGIRDRWTNKDMLWAYKLGLRRGKKVKIKVDFTKKIKGLK